MEPTPAGATELGHVDLYWLRLGAGGARCVRGSRRSVEAIVARHQQRDVHDLYDSALQVRLGGDRFVIEMAPVWSMDTPGRGWLPMAPWACRGWAAPGCSHGCWHAAGTGWMRLHLLRTAPHARDHAGLAALQAHLRARRIVLFERFLALWGEYERKGFRARLEYAAGERPEVDDEPSR